MTHRRTDPLWLGRLYAKMIALPVLAFAAAAISDWAYSASLALQYSNFSAWLLLFGLIGGIAALLVLALSVRDSGGTWLGAGVLAIGLIVEIVNFMVHMRDGYTTVVPLGIALSVIGALIVAAAAWLTRTSTREARA